MILMSDTELDQKKSMDGLFGHLSLLGKQVGELWEPEVEKIIKGQVKDDTQIQQVLDGLLEGAFHERTLGLFRCLCQYYYHINPEATARSIHEYRDLWDSEECDHETI
jgi:hypothetical protein